MNFVIIYNVLYLCLNGVLLGHDLEGGKMKNLSSEGFTLICEARGEGWVARKSCDEVNEKDVIERLHCE